MRKFLFTLMIILTGIAVKAQHLEFEGISIDGTVGNFESQLLRKGFTLADSYNEADTVNPIRYFFGKNWGYDCLLSVIYEPKSKIVYSCTALMPYKYETLAEKVLDSIRDKIKTKYGNNVSELVKNQPVKSYDYTVTDYDSETGGEVVLGDITLTIKKVSDLPAVEVHYSDMTNMLNLFD